MSTPLESLDDESPPPLPPTQQHPLIHLTKPSHPSSNSNPGSSSSSSSYSYPAYVDPYQDHQDPPERYPLPYPARRRSWTFYPALVLVGGLGGSIPASLCMVGWYIFKRTIPEGIIPRALLVYAVLELLTTAYQTHLTHTIQPPSAPSTLSAQECLGILMRILQSGTGPRLGVDTLGGLGGGRDGKGEEKQGGEGLRRRVGKAQYLGSEQDGSLPTDTYAHDHDDDTNGNEGGRKKEKPGYTASPLIPLETLDKDDPRAVEFRERLRNWFGRVPFSSITLPDAQAWLSWSCCGMSYDQVQRDPDKSSLIETGVRLLQARTGWMFPLAPAENNSGPREKVRLMRLTMDPVKVWPRPLWWYAALWAGDVLAMRYIYHRFGLRQYKQGQMDYLVRIPKGWNPEHQRAKSDPIVFIHGLGFGLLSPENMLVIRKLCKTLSSHPILIPLQPQISQQPWDPRHLYPTPRKQVVGDLVDACKRWRFYDDQGVISPVRAEHDNDDSDAGDRLDRLDGPRENGGVILLSHSNGSVAHTWILKDVPGLTKRNALVDPVVFCSWEGDLCYNFCYRPARGGLECLLKYLIATELGIANAIQRHFDWSANTLFPEEIPEARDPERTLIVLGGTDIIVDAKRVRGYLKRHGLRRTMQYDPTKGHSDGIRGTSLDRLIIWLATGKSVDVPSASAWH